MPATMLLAEDSLTIRRVIELTFANEDVTIVSVGDGEAAVRQIEMDRPDIVLADVGMPKLDGYAVASHIKQSPALRDIPVLLLTGAFEPIDEDRARDSGCDGILVKPFDPHLLLARVKELIAGRHRAAVSPADGPRAALPAPEAVGHDIPPALETVSYSFGIHTPEPPPAPSSSHAAATPVEGIEIEGSEVSPLDLLDPAVAGELDPVVPDEEVLELTPEGNGGLDLEFDQIEAAFEQRHPHEIPAGSGTDPRFGVVLDPVVWGDRMSGLEEEAHAAAIPLDAPSAAPVHVDEAQADWSVSGPVAHSAALVIDEDLPTLSLAHQHAVPELHESPTASLPVAPVEPLGAPAPVLSAPQPAEPPTESRPAAAPVAPVRTARFTPRVSLASAFSALLAAEQAPPVPQAANAPAVSEAMVEELVRRVLTRMTEETVHRLVVDTAERVIRQEMDRIKADPHS